MWKLTNPGLNYNLPEPVGEVFTPKVTRVNRVEIGFRSSGDSNSDQSLQDVPEESLMLTGDENIISMQFVVLWQIKDPLQYLFAIRDPEETVKNVSESVMREIIGQTAFEYARTQGRGQIEGTARERMQKLLDEYQSGVLVTQVAMQNIAPPEATIDAFRDVQAASADKERSVNEAQAYFNEVTQRAGGQAQQIIKGAEAYKEQTVAIATGNAQRFVSVLDAVPQGPGDHPAPHLSGDHGAGAAEHEQGAGGRARAGAARCPICPLNDLLKSADQPDPAAARQRCGDGYQPRPGSKPMNRPLIGIVVGVVVAAILLLSACYVVQPSERALVLQLGNPVPGRTSVAGLYFKIPFVQNVVFFDSRVLNYDAPAEEVPTVDLKQVDVSSFAVYRIVNPLLFYQTVNNEIGVQGRLGAIMSANLRQVLGNVSMAAILTQQRAQFMQEIARRVNTDTKSFGIQVIDVRIKRVDLPPANSQAIFRRMQTQREQAAAAFRAEGQKDAVTLRAEADKQAVVIVANARKQGEILRGEGDGAATAVYAAAYGRNPAFFDFYPLDAGAHHRPAPGYDQLCRPAGRRFLPLFPGQQLQPRSAAGAHGGKSVRRRAAERPSTTTSP